MILNNQTTAINSENVDYKALLVSPNQHQALDGSSIKSESIHSLYDSPTFSNRFSIQAEEKVHEVKDKNEN